MILTTETNWDDPPSRVVYRSKLLLMEELPLGTYKTLGVTYQPQLVSLPDFLNHQPYDFQTKTCKLHRVLLQSKLPGRKRLSFVHLYPLPTS